MNDQDESSNRAETEEGLGIDEPIGRATATERVPNSSEKFSFWLRPNRQLNPFDIVAADHPVSNNQGELVEESTTFGLVVNIRHSTDAPSHLSNYIANDFGELIDEPNTPRQGTNVAEVNVLSNSANNYMPIQNEALVYFANEDQIHEGLGIDMMKQKEADQKRPICVPAGLMIMSNKIEASAILDVDYVLGPESAHVNISGISGLATKTSYAMFLIQSILQTMDREVEGGSGQVESKDVAVVILNVKYHDLLTIDEKPEPELPEEQKELWRKLGLDPRPFQNVVYLLPAGKDSERDPLRANSYYQPDLLTETHDTKIYAYELRDCVDKLPALLSDVPDEYGVIEAIVGHIQDGLDPKRPKKEWADVKTWDDLLWKSPLSRWADGSEKPPGALMPRSILRFFRYINKAVKHRNSGVFVNKRHDGWTTVGSELERIQGGKTYVVDIAKLHDNEQMMVFGDIVRTVYEVFAGAGETGLDLGDFDEGEYAPPKRVIIFVDELNKYAPSERGRASPILEDILEISERGRALGVILVSAQQFSSAVHQRVIGNSGTKIFGRTAPTELVAPGYRFLDDAVKGHLTRLEKGELLITHPIYRQPVKIRFPWPAFRQLK